MTDLVIRARRVVTPAGVRPAEVRIRDGRITSVDSPVLTSSSGITLADDEVLLPGLVDTHVHVNEPGRTEWEGFATATAAAAAGGVTTIIDMPLNSVPPTVDLASLRLKQEAARGQCAVDVGFWGGAVPGNSKDRAALHEGGVFGFKCFTVDSGVEEFPPLADAELELVMRQVAELGSVLIVHAEDASRIGTAAGRQYAGFVRSRPQAAETAAIARVIELAKARDARVHVLHLSAADAVPLLARAQADGVRVTAETCPHYLALSAEAVPDGHTQFKCCPPIREESNRERLWQALAEGVITSVVSDHSPCSPELKRLDTGDFGAAWGGISSVQLGLPVVWTHGSRRGCGLSEVSAWMAANPARLAGLPGKGLIAAGMDADLVAFAPDEEFVVRPGQLRTRHRLTPYEGQKLRGVVRKTWLAGEPVIAGQPAGRLLART
ncbi:MAG TPA: allantoinase AllB [Streptosporangiaceae bacterium]|nr:allantoinase AllB [Streptosporangiaceae bacterium]